MNIQVGKMTSIAAKILSSIGAYRFTQEHLTFYIVFNNELTQEQYDNWKEHAVTYESHGTSRSAFVCQHLNKDTYTGFHEAFESNPLIEPDDDYQAWCDIRSDRRTAIRKNRVTLLKSILWS